MKDNNKLITDFMGVVPEYEVNEPLFNITYNYHEDWNLLIQAISKIKKIDDVGTGVEYVEIFNCLDDLDIETTHQAVVEFIKWYNENNSIK